MVAAALIMTGCSGPGGPAGCEVNLELTNAETGTSTTLTEAVAISVANGAGYTVYAADYAFEEEVTYFFDPDVPTEGNLAFVSVTVFNAEGAVPPLEEGQVVAAGAEAGEHALVFIHSTAESEYGQSANPSGQATITQVGDRFCAEIDYRDDQKSLTGTVGAEIGARG